MTRVFLLFTDLKEARQYCYNHSMKDINRLALVKCGYHKSDVYYVVDSKAYKNLVTNGFKMETLYVYE